MDTTELSPIEYDYNAGLVCKTLSAGRACVDTGFYVAQKSTSISVSVARGAITTTASIAGILTGNIGLMAVLYGVDTTIGAAEHVAQAAIMLSRSMALAGFSAASATLEHTGAAESIERGLWVKVGEVSELLPWQEHSDAIARIFTMVHTFTVPLRELTSEEIKTSIKKFALLQQSRRLPLQLSAENTLSGNEDLSRCMAFAAVSYGHLAINFLEFLPKGTYQSNILSYLAPGVSYDDIIVENQQDSIYRPGYMVLLDNVKKDIVVSLRGTMNPHDILTDLTCHHSPCDNHMNESDSGDIIFTETNVSDLFPGYKGVVVSHFAHEGFLRSAVALSELLRPAISKLLSEHPDYGLLVCGHSLGAGVASLLALKWTTIFPMVRCVAFSPPCVLSLEAARSLSDRVTSVVVGDDMVCRFGIGASLDLRDACLRLHSISSGENLTALPDDELVRHLREEHMVNKKLYPPGKIVHIVKHDEFFSRQTIPLNEKNYLVKRGDEIAYVSDQLTFSELQISGTMFSSHMPHKVLSKVQEFFPRNEITSQIA